MVKKIIFILFIFSLLVISGCKGIPTGKGIINPEETKPQQDSVNDQKIEECIKLCGDNSRSNEEIYNSCSKIYKYGGEELFNLYLEQCKKGI